MSVEYDERLTVPLRWWVQGTMLVATLWLAVVVALPPAAAWTVTGIALLLLFVGLWTYGSPRVQVGGGVFRAVRPASRAITSASPPPWTPKPRAGSPAATPTRAPSCSCGPT